MPVNSMGLWFILNQYIRSNALSSLPVLTASSNSESLFFFDKVILTSLIIYLAFFIFFFVKIVIVSLFLFLFF